MKVILCLHHFLPDFVGGTEIYTLNIAKYLIEKNIDVLVLIPNLGIEKTEEYGYEGVRIIKYAENSIEDRDMILGKKKPSGLKEFSEIIQKENPDIVHFHELAPGKGISIFHVEKIHELKIKVIITLHVSFYSCFKGTLLYKNKEQCDGKIILERCTSCIYHEKNIKGLKASLLKNTAMALYKLHINATSVNGSMGTALGFPYVIDKIRIDLLRLSFLAEKIIVIADWYKNILERNGVPQEKLIYIKQGLPNEIQNKPLPRMIDLPLKVVFIGRINKLKGLHLLTEAVSKIDSTKINLDIYGPGDESGYGSILKEKIKDYKNICWNGRIASADVIETLAKYHVMCLPSAFEMSPLVIQEAFAAGIPVLASDVYGNAEQVRNGENGWLFKFNDVENLKDKLEMLINNTSLITGAMKILPGLNSFREAGSQHLKLYEAVAEKYSYA